MGYKKLQKTLKKIYATCTTSPKLNVSTTVQLKIKKKSELVSNP